MSISIMRFKELEPDVRADLARVYLSTLGGIPSCKAKEGNAQCCRSGEHYGPHVNIDLDKKPEANDRVLTWF